MIIKPKNLLFNIIFLISFEVKTLWACTQSLVEEDHISSSLYSLCQAYTEHHPQIEPPEKSMTLQKWNSWLQKNFLRPANLDHQDIKNLPQDLYHTEYIPFYKQLGLVQEKTPLKKQYNIWVVFGGTPWDTLKRFEWVEYMWNQGIYTKKILYINGQRKLNSTEKKWMINHYNTKVSFQHEAALFIWTQKITDDSLKNLFEVMTIPAPSKNKRANTQDTLERFFQSSFYILGSNTLFISNQPYGLYQSLTVETVQKKLGLPTLNTETVYSPLLGAEINKTNTRTFLDTLARQFYTAIQK